MKHSSHVFVSFLSALPFFGAQAVYAGTPAGEVVQLSGFVMALKASGGLKVLSPQSTVESGDILVSEENTYVRLALANGRQAVLGPQTRLELTSAAMLHLKTGQLQVIAAAQSGAGDLTIEAGENIVEAGTASFNLFYIPDPATALAQRAYARASLALITSPVKSDAGTALPLWEPVAQVSPLLAPVARNGPVLPPGLYVSVLDGTVEMSNRGGTQNFSAGQFGYTPNFIQPPLLVPVNPGLQFSAPPAFSAPLANSSSSKPGTVDCVVR